MMRYDLTTSHVPGKSMLVADSLSVTPDEADTTFSQETATLHIVHPESF